TLDPTAHAEVVAIPNACRAQRTFRQSDCQLYTSCEPCPMCLGAIYWARLAVVFYGNSRCDAAHIGFDDEWLYREVATPLGERRVPMVQLLADEALEAFQAWRAWSDKTPY
ncbi:MAG: nucleoside deaminase, partial [Candidatus Competibacterales bacterium]